MLAAGTTIFVQTTLAWSRFVLACWLAASTIRRPNNPWPSVTRSEDGSLKRIAHPVFRAANRVATLTILGALLASSVGCSPRVRMPRLYNPGPAGYQRYNAQEYADPYPLPDAGPEVVGARPRGFMTPRPQVERARAYSRSQGTPQFIAPAPQVAPGF